jgi:hypothetical protein
MTRDRPNKPDELLLWLRGRYPNDTDEELTKRFREHARDDLTIVNAERLFSRVEFQQTVEACPGAPA